MAERDLAQILNPPSPENFHLPAAGSPALPGHISGIFIQYLLCPPKPNRIDSAVRPQRAW